MKANINGVTLKNVIEYRGIETDHAIQADIYLGKMKIGTYDSNARGGPVDVDLLPEYRDHIRRIAVGFFEKFENGFFPTSNEGFGMTIQELYKDTPTEGLIGELVELYDTEKYYKRLTKGGSPVLTIYKKGTERMYISWESEDMMATQRESCEKKYGKIEKIILSLADLQINI